MRRLLPWFASAVGGAVVAVLGVLASFWWAHRDDTVDAGFYSYSPPPRRYVDYLLVSDGPDWAALLLPAAVAGGVLGLAAFGVVAVVRWPRP